MKTTFITSSVELLYTLVKGGLTHAHGLLVMVEAKGEIFSQTLGEDKATWGVGGTLQNMHSYIT